MMPARAAGRYLRRGRNRFRVVTRERRQMIAGTRTLTVETEAGEQAVGIRMFLPEPAGRSWDCRYEIDWPEGTIKSFAGGNDAIAALHAAIEKIGMEVYMSHYHHERKMWWLKPWAGYGFPVPKSGRDLLIGHDQLFYGLDGRDEGGGP